MRRTAIRQCRPLRSTNDSWLWPISGLRLKISARSVVAQIFPRGFENLCSTVRNNPADGVFLVGIGYNDRPHYRLPFDLARFDLGRCREDVERRPLPARLNRVESASLRRDTG